jgi:hypothetical protein
MIQRGLTVEQACPWLFAVLALAAALFLAWNVPPFMGADEVQHFERAAIGAHGWPVGQRFVRNGRVASGGDVEEGLRIAARGFDHIPFHPERKANPADFAAAAAGSWRGPTFAGNFSGASAYPPFFYLPASAAIVLGRMLGWSVVATLYAARFAQALTCVVTSFAALSLAGRSRFLLYAVLTAPMTLAVFASVTADGLLIATTALGTALVCRALVESRPLTTIQLVGAAVCFALVGMTKPPYALFGLVLLAAPATRPRLCWWAAGAVLAAALGWLALTAAFVQAPLLRPSVRLDPAGQLAWLFTHSAEIPGLALHTLASNAGAYRMTTIGVLGWLDTPLPPLYYPLAWAVLMLAAIVSAPVSLGPWPAMRWTGALVCLGVFAAIHLALYVTWNAVGAPLIEGVAGRYFLPLGCVLALALDGGRALLPQAGKGAWLGNWMRGVILAFPLVSLAVVERAVILRYYLD